MLYGLRELQNQSGGKTKDKYNIIYKTQGCANE